MNILDEFGSIFVKRRIIIVADLLKSQNQCHCKIKTGYELIFIRAAHTCRFVNRFGYRPYNIGV
ncbi:unnamed protein product [Callosobruchus maculatus]|uniref:Uncharacterized protein n=1 Tax=Callosobruchus maculatus TaxID=64391 RepID=A0A653CBZ3_CALMS|nr:unnamed protein product [Callosobruchus maculatus]